MSNEYQNIHILVIFFLIPLVWAFADYTLLMGFALVILHVNEYTVFILNVVVQTGKPPPVTNSQYEYISNITNLLFN